MRNGSRGHTLLHRLYLHVEAVVRRLEDQDISYYRDTHRDTGGAGLCVDASLELGHELERLGWSARVQWTDVMRDLRFAPWYPGTKGAKDAMIAAGFGWWTDHTVCTVEIKGAGYHVFPVRAYVHSGVALSLSASGYPFNDIFDSGWAGFVAVAKDALGDDTWRARYHPGKNDAEVAKIIAAGHVETWNQALSGDVWGFVVQRQLLLPGDDNYSCRSGTG